MDTFVEETEGIQSSEEIPETQVCGVGNLGFSGNKTVMMDIFRTYHIVNLPLCVSWREESFHPVCILLYGIKHYIYSTGIKEVAPCLLHHGRTSPATSSSTWQSFVAVYTFAWILWAG